MNCDWVDSAAADLRTDCSAFTRRGLYYSALRQPGAANAATTWTFPRFCEGPLAARLRLGPIPGLLQGAYAKAQRRSLPPEWSAYFPAAILVVDRPEIVDVFAASGVLVQARIAVVCIDGSPPNVVRWLRSGWGAGHRAPVGYLHDARTVVYPFLCEPLATFRARSPRDIVYRDLGIGPCRALSDPLGIASAYASRATELDELPPCSLVAYAATQLMAMVEGDPLLAPIDPIAPNE